MMNLTDYLVWARTLDGWLHKHPGCYNLFSSAIHEPTVELETALKQTYQDDWQSRLDEPTNWGHPRLISALAARYAVHDEDRVLITTGASIAFVLIAQALLQPGDHAIVEVPNYQPFVNVLTARGVEISFCERPSPSYQPDPDALEDLVKPNTRLIALTDLHNPSGALLDQSVLKAIAGIADQHDIKVVVDEVYRDFAAEVATTATLHDAIVSISSLSKVYGLSALRVGWIFAAPEVIAQLRPVHATFDNASSRIIQAMTTVVLDDAEPYRQRALRIVAENKALMQEFSQALLSAGILAEELPRHGCIYFPRVAGWEDTSELADQLLEEFGVVVVPGRFFGAPQHIRISFGGKPHLLAPGLERLGDGLRALQRV